MQVIVSTNLAVSLSGPASNASYSGASTVFTATGSGGNPIYSYSFYINNTVVTNGVSGNTFTTSTLSNNDVVKVKITDSYGCSVFSSDLTMTIHSQPNPVLYHE